MGQYYKPICLTSFEWLYSHEYNHNGLKLMEHSWIGNDFTGVIMKLLTKGEKWYKGRIVWAGDYSSKIYEEENLYSMAYDEDDKEGVKLFKKINPKPCMPDEEQKRAIIVNHSKKEYVRIEDCKPQKDGWIINPLPLLTALGNGGGGGDYAGSCMNFVGRWAFDEISIEFDEKELIGFKKITTIFDEGTEEDGNSEGNEAVVYHNLKGWLKNVDVKRRMIIAKL